jgi:uncharacterized membrane protein
VIGGIFIRPVAPTSRLAHQRITHQMEAISPQPTMTQSPPIHDHSPGLSPVIERNIAALLERQRAEQRRLRLQERLADRITRWAGSMNFVYLHVLLFGIWILSNIGWLPILPRFDPSFVILAMFASVEAIFLSTFVLISQNRMSASAEKRSELDLQISLLAEHEITRLITMVSALARKARVEQPEPAELSDLQKDIAPEKVLDRIEHATKHG